MKKKLFVLGLTLVMLSLIATPAFAQEIGDPVETPPVEEEASGFLDHPIVQLLADFLSDFFNPPAEEEPVPDDGVVPNEEPPAGEPSRDEGGSPEEELPVEPEPTEEPVVPEEKIASMHEEDDLGFGEIVKLTEIAKQAQQICVETGEFCDVDLDGLIGEYKDGTGMGALFKKYGKPENTGVGHIRKAADPKNKEKRNNGKKK